MKLVKNVVFVSLTTLLAACNSGGEDQDSFVPPAVSTDADLLESSSVENVTPSEPSEPSEPSVTPDLSGANGVYYLKDLPVSLIIDLERETFPVVGIDLVRNLFFMVDKAQLEGNLITTTGYSGFLRDADADSSNNFVVEQDEAKSLSIELADMQAKVNVPIDGSEFSYQFTDKTSSSMLSQLVGDHTAADGSAVSIDENGALIINSAQSSYYCTFEANLKQMGVYYDMENLQASSCANESLNGAYQQGSLITVKDDKGDTFMLTLLIKDQQQIAWGSTQIN